MVSVTAGLPSILPGSNVQPDYAANKTMVAAAYRARASVRLAAGRKAEARSDVEQATALFRAAGKAGEGYLRLMEPLRQQIETP